VVVRGGRGGLCAHVCGEGVVDGAVGIGMKILMLMLIVDVDVDVVQCLSSWSAVPIAIWKSRLLKRLAVQ
jgi:hypothetical protein